MHFIIAAFKGNKQIKNIRSVNCWDPGSLTQEQEIWRLEATEANVCANSGSGTLLENDITFD